VAGLGRDGLARVMPELTRAGLLPVQGGGAGTSPAPSPPLEPGSAVGVKLTRGDLDITATGTVTWVDGSKVLAFGHPFFGLGPVDLPLTGARAEALLPTLEQSFRMATPLSELGAFRQDRLSGIFGEIGASSKMVPVRLQINSRGGTKEEFAFDVADDPLLTPVLVYVSLNGILASKERIAGGVTLRLAEGSVIKIEGEDDIELDNLYTGPSAGMFATGIPAYVLYLMMNGDWEPPRIKGINLIFEYDSEPQSGRIRRVSLDRTRVRAGDTVGVTIVLAPYRGPELVDTHEIRIPPETPPGKLQLFVGDAADLERIEGADDGYLPIELHQLIKIVNQLRRNDRIYILATREDSGLILGGDRLPHLPPSMLTVLTRPRSQGNFVMVPRRAVLEEEIEAGFAVEGLSRLQIDVESR
jgi:hypothetical protein